MLKTDIDIRFDEVDPVLPATQHQFRFEFFYRLRKELMPGRDLDIEVLRCHNHRLEPQPIFIYTYGTLGVSSENMYKRFNNGIGYDIAVDPSIREDIWHCLARISRADVIGEVKKGTGKISIESAYEPITVEYQA